MKKIKECIEIYNFLSFIRLVSVLYYIFISKILGKSLLYINIIILCVIIFCLFLSPVLGVCMDMDIFRKIGGCFWDGLFSSVLLFCLSGFSYLIFFSKGICLRLFYFLLLILGFVAITVVGFLSRDFYFNIIKYYFRNDLNGLFLYIKLNYIEIICSVIIPDVISLFLILMFVHLTIWVIYEDLNPKHKKVYEEIFTYIENIREKLRNKNMEGKNTK